MKKYLLFARNILLIAILTFTGCKKEKTEENAIKSSNEDAASESVANKYAENSCRLMNLDWPAAGLWQFHYNDKGLADQWTISFGSDILGERMYYDQHNRLIRAEEDFFGVASYVHSFYYRGKRLTRVTRVNVDFPEDATDFAFTYNWKGQIIRQDDNIHDQHVLMYYDVIGNCTRTDLYFGSDLVFSDIYTYNTSARNPKQNIPGVDIGFPFYGTGGLTDKRWFTSNKTITYDNGNPILINDYDPLKTSITTANNHLPVTASYFDLVTESTVDITFDYENCGGIHHWNHDRNLHANKVVGNKKVTDHRPFLLVRGSSKSVREQIQKLTAEAKGTN